MEVDNIYYNKEGIALITVLILVIILTILTGIILTLLSSQVSLIEHSNSRTESRYADEAVMVRQLELLRKGIALDSYHYINDMRVNVAYATGAGLNQTDQLNLTHDYGFNY